MNAVGRTPAAGPRADPRDPANVIHDIALLRRPAAEAARLATAAELKRLWSQIDPLLPGDRARTRADFEVFCDAAAHRRIRRRQVLVLAYGIVAFFSSAPTTWLAAFALRPARPEVLIAYAVTTLVLALPAWAAVRSHRVLCALLVAAIAGPVCWVFWRYRPPGTWDPRAMLAAPAGDQQRLVTGAAVGAALTLVLIVFALSCAAALVVVSRFLHVGGTVTVRAFDELLAVVELLLQTGGRPGGDRRRRIDESLRTAELALLVMARGGRPAGRRSRRHRRELRAQQARIAELIRDPNPLLGVRDTDDDLLNRTVTCLIALCRDQLGDLVRTIQNQGTGPAGPPPATPVAKRRRRGFRLFAPPRASVRGLATVVADAVPAPGPAAESDEDGASY